MRLNELGTGRDVGQMNLQHSLGMCQRGMLDAKRSGIA
jgi:hypothetical protein